ncbi:MAG: serine hydrolase domain-containing protein, partial [Flavobacteriaceae bacterium]|nr:serine hydrolase domain-containing protein [Flavobacteriaceae bacterium]
PDYANNITVQNLLNHTSGIRDYLTLSYLKGHSDDDFYTDEDVMDWLIKQTELNFQPNAEYVYSNSGYWLLGQIVKKISGKNMAEFAEENIFKPLGMNHTHFHNDHTKIVKKRATGYVPNGNGGYKISVTTLDMIGDGGIFTSIKDIKKWDDEYYKREVLNDKFWEMMTSQGKLSNNKQIEYASGLVIGNYRGLNTISHGGAFVGYRADLLRFPDQKTSIAIFANRGDANPTAKAFAVADVILKDQLSAINQPNKKKGNKAIKMTREQLSKFEGHYWTDQSSFSREIKVKNDTLRYIRSSGFTSYLIPISNDEFVMPESPIETKIHFNLKSKTPEMTFYAEGDTPLKFRKYEIPTYEESELSRYTGIYFSPELDINYEIIMEKGKLKLFQNKKELYELIPVTPNVFQTPAGTLFFETSEKGKVEIMKLNAGRVKNLRFNKVYDL